ncbi:MAG TPA: 16S rRNA (adenine(1518)-N(6)/adenine(1519)-N(6))-dimethyltransferase RsmA [Candidatus Paceibacterota bacterium]|nr:16S rRNA (adenine(1518)-N(6)/adenine(1519)-N(6))-dimethyltransferase RsmA [Candidatus Paceibacterota bacterium]
MRAKKSLGQNFLMHARIAERIADAALLTANDTVLEIGPGTGMLTRPLLARARRVVAVEADHTLIATLEETFATEIKEKKLTLVYGDIRAFDPASIGEPYALVANIPYYITGEIIRSFLGATHAPFTMTLLVQKEVAERIARSKKESILSLAVKVYGDPKYSFTVPRGAFLPAPNVDSAVLTITNIKNPFSSKNTETFFFDLLHAGFAHKRKLLIRNLEAVADASLLTTAFAEASISEKARAEDLSLATWKKLAQLLGG